MTSTKQKNKKMQSLEGERKARISEAPPTVSTPCLVSSSNGKHTLRAVTNVHMYIYTLSHTLVSFLSHSLHTSFFFIFQRLRETCITVTAPSCSWNALRSSYTGSTNSPTTSRTKCLRYIFFFLRPGIKCVVPADSVGAPGRLS
uniref:Uncharacterized protein n=1 Tax=Rhipicephalus zambeziensis TaxID=60191 RepID=A0A224YK65_9ACAR